MSHNLIRVLVVPSLGLSVEEVTVVGWLMKEGDSFESGDEICELETEKTVNVMEAPFSGTLRSIVAQAGDILEVRATLAVVADVETSDEQIAAFLVDYRPPTEIESEQVDTLDSPEIAPESVELLPTPASTGEPGAGDAGADDSLVHATPRARELAASASLSLHNVSGTGRNGRISRRDVDNALKKSGVAIEAPFVPRTLAQETTILDVAADAVPLSSMRRKIANRLQQSKLTIPHYRLVVDVKMDSLMRARRKLNLQQEQKISINDFIVKACAHALIEVPEVNIQFDGEFIARGIDADVAIAVALDGGLITPVLRAAQSKSLPDIASQTQDLVDRAKSRSLQPEEYQGGTFCVSNLGMYGIKQFDAIINPPHGAILAVGAVRECVVFVDDRPAKAHIMTTTLSCDHRVIDGALAARYLAAMKRMLENPMELSE